MGAVYQAAALSKAFKVKPFLVRDAAVFPIQVSAGHSLPHAAGDNFKYHRFRKSLVDNSFVEKRTILVVAINVCAEQK